MNDIRRDLLGPGMDLIETHTAWVLLGRKEVWKVKKPVNFGFLDFRTLEARHAACDAEVRLNARLAPGVYEGVVPVTRDSKGKCRLGGDGEIVDYAVRMRRLRDSVRGDVLLSEEALSGDRVDELADDVASFHARMPTSAEISAFGAPEVVLGNVRENFAQTEPFVGEHVTGEQAAEIQSRQIAFVEGHRPLFEARVRDGRVRDGHGDLRLEHVYFELGRQPRIIDCIEFNERFRYADVCADIAFLSMDFERLGRVDLAERFLAAYARRSGDYDLYALVDFYEAYRAYVRGKVSALLAADSSADLETRARASDEARTYFLVALGEGRRRIVGPAVVAVGGVIASGKSTIAEHLGAAMSAPVVDTDRTRKALLGVEPTTRLAETAWKGAYAVDVTDRVYSEAFRRASVVLSSGRSVILDASFRTRALRAEARALAKRHTVPFHFVECRIAPDECRRRLKRRESAPNVSDGRQEILEDFAARFEPVTELPVKQHLAVDTALPVDENLRHLERALPAWPQGFNR